MRTHLQYGTAGLDVELRAKDLTVLEPRYLPGLPDEAAAFREAVEHPIARPPLRELVRSTDRVAVVIPDITRPLPTERLLPWLFDALPEVPPDRFVVVNGTGYQTASIPCISVDNKTPFLYGDMAANVVLEASGKNLVTLQPPPEVTAATAADIINKQQLIPKTAKIGILSNNEPTLKAGVTRWRRR
jgi:hypothetical protein